MLPKFAKSKLRNFELQCHHNEVYYLVYHNMVLRHMIDYKITVPHFKMWLHLALGDRVILSM